jgi:hypothetical protein
VFKQPLSAFVGLFRGSQHSQDHSSSHQGKSRRGRNGNLDDNHSAWQRLYVGNATFSNQVTTESDYELFAHGPDKEPPTPGITQVTNVEVSFQDDDQKSDASARPLRDVR